MMAIAVTMCKLFVTLAVGFFLAKKDMLDEHTGKKLSALIVNVVMPCLIISSVAGVKGDKGEVLSFFFTGLLFYCAFPVIGWAAVRLMRVPVNLRGTYMCMIIFSNCSFMGFPVIAALFGNSSIFYSNIFHMGFNLGFFTLGLALLRGDVKRTEIAVIADGAPEYAQAVIADGAPEHVQAAIAEEKSPGKRGQTVRQILNNGVIASVLALIIYFADIPLPVMVTETAGFIGNISMPLSMMVIGSSIAGYSFKEIFSNTKVYLISLVRLIVMPVLAWLFIQLFTDNDMLIKVVTITVGMPIASMVAMGAAPYKEQGKEASIAVVFSTLCSLITIPVMCVLLTA